MCESPPLLRALASRGFVRRAVNVLPPYPST